MTATKTPTTETPSGEPPVRPQLGVVSAAGFIVLAATALLMWLLTINSAARPSHADGGRGIGAASGASLGPDQLRLELGKRQCPSCLSHVLRK